MAHIAFISYPNRGHVNPAVPILSTLVRRGHRVTFATAEEYASRVEASGAEVVRYPSPSQIAAQDGNRTFCQLAIRVLASIGAFYRQSPPDLIIGDFAMFAGRILAHRLGIPLAQISPHFAYDPEYLRAQIRHPTFRNQALQASTDADRFLVTLGLKSEGFIFHREPLNIFLFPKEFEPSEVFDERNFYAGRCAGEQAPFGNWKAGHQAGSPLVLVATSMTHTQGPDYFRVIVDALGASDWRVVLSLGDKTDPLSLGSLPSNFEVVQRISHTRILPHASAMIYMGGTISAAEAAYHGVPLLITSRGILELEGYADNLVRLGIAVHLRENEVSVERLLTSIALLVTDATVASNVTALQHRVQRAPGGEETANRIEEYLEACRSGR